MNFKPQEEKLIEEVFAPDVFGIPQSRLREYILEIGKPAALAKSYDNNYKLLQAAAEQLPQHEYLRLLAQLFDYYNVYAKKERSTSFAVKRYKDYLQQNYTDAASKDIIRRMRAFGDFLRKVRESKGVSVMQLAERTNLSRTEIYRLEKGERVNPSAPVLKAIALALNTPLSDFLEAGGFELEMPTEDKPVIAAHIQGSEDLTDEEISEVKKYIDFLKSRRKT